jgi:hypothetical protein
MFSDRNATRHDVSISTNPDIVRFDVVRAENAFKVPDLLRPFYQAEVLVPSPIPQHLVMFPREKKPKK